jgi:Uma2 family endonuclease
VFARTDRGIRSFGSIASAAWAQLRPVGRRNTFTLRSRAMADPARKFATYEDVLSAPEHRIAQVIDGELVLQPRPAGSHSVVASELGADLVTPFRRGRGGPGGWRILFEPELHLGSPAQILVPDLAGWRNERITFSLKLPFFDVAPDWVCEVLSPGTARLDRGRKADIYAEQGVQFLWLVDPDARHIEAFRIADGSWLRIGLFADAGARIPPFDAVPLDVPSFFDFGNEP